MNTEDTRTSGVDDTDPLTGAVLGYSASQRCDVANPGGQPCSRRKGHAGAHDQQSYGPTEPTVEEALKELREMLPDRVVQIDSRDRPIMGRCYRIVIDGRRRQRDWSPTLSECMAQVRAWKQEQEKSNV